MVKSSVYCAEQIAVPALLPTILKSYVKAAIRTQPGDLLRWSAAYFRCLAIDVPPPVKVRLETDGPAVASTTGYRIGNLTRGYLRILIAQIGKGYFVSNDVLQTRWHTLCLSEDELYKYMSLSRMLTHSQVHWLKLVAIMAGSLTNNIRETAIMLCELLTDGPDGGPSPIPMWMFQECFSFIAKLDCSGEQSFIDGRKLFDDGHIEELQEIGNSPSLLSMATFRDLIIDEWKHEIETDRKAVMYQRRSSGSKPGTGRKSNRLRYDVQSQVDAKTDFRRDNENNDDTDDDHHSSTCDDNESLGVAIKAAPDFETLILILNEMQDEGHPTDYTYEGPHYVSDKDLERARARESDIIRVREQQLSTIGEEANDIAGPHYRPNVDERCGAIEPWSWLHQFVSANCATDKSYNFIEHQSIASDRSVSDDDHHLSSERFDFDRENFIRSASASGVTVNSGAQSPQSSTLSMLADVHELMNDIAEDGSEGGEIEASSGTIIPSLDEADTDEAKRMQDERAEFNDNFQSLMNVLLAMVDRIGEVELPATDASANRAFIESQVTEIVENAIAGRRSIANGDGNGNDGAVDGDNGTGNDNDNNVNGTGNVENKVSIDYRPIHWILDIAEQEELVFNNLSEFFAYATKMYERWNNHPDEFVQLHNEKYNIMMTEQDNNRIDNRSGSDHQSEVDVISTGIDVKVNENIKGTDVQTLSSTQRIGIVKANNKSKIITPTDIVDVYEASGITVDGRTLTQKIPSQMILGVVLSNDGNDTELSSQHTPVHDDKQHEECQDEHQDRNGDATFECENSALAVPSAEMKGIASGTSCSKAEQLESLSRLNDDTVSGTGNVAAVTFRCTVPEVPGIGRPITEKTVNDFLTYLKHRSYSQHGMIYPHNFVEDKCPNMIDCV